MLRHNKPEYGSRDRQAKYRHNPEKAEKEDGGREGGDAIKRKQASRSALVGVGMERAVGKAGPFASASQRVIGMWEVKATPQIRFPGHRKHTSDAKVTKEGQAPLLLATREPAYFLPASLSGRASSSRETWNKYGQERSEAWER